MNSNPKIEQIKAKLSTVASQLLRNMQGLVPKFSFDWGLFADSFEGYLDARFTILKLEIKEMLAHTARRIAVGMVIIMLGTLAMFLFSLGMALLINEATSSPYWGFLIVAFVYLLIAAGLGIYAKEVLFKDRKSEAETGATESAAANAPEKMESGQVTPEPVTPLKTDEEL